MKKKLTSIVFLTTSLELGKNGVGDYTYTLASHLARKGVIVKIIALHDRFVQSVSLYEDEVITGLRLPQELSWRKKIAEAQSWLGDFRPNWYSLQLVGYGYDAKGLFYNISKATTKIVGEGWLHIFLHELWPGAIGVTKGKRAIVSAFQKHSFFYLINQTIPRLLDTSINAYQQFLKDENLNSGLIPLPSSLPFQDDDGSRPLPANDDSATVLFFASMYERFDYASCLRYLVQLFNKPIKIFHLGHTASIPASLIESLRAHKDHITFQKLENLSDSQITQAFYQADIGVNTTPAAGIGKSSSYTAMRQTGLPVLTQEQNIPVDQALLASQYPNVIAQEMHAAETLSLANFRLPPKDETPQIIETFYHRLSNYEA